MINKLAVVIPNWNGEDIISQCLDSLFAQSVACTIIVVDNGSIDESATIISKKYPDVILLKQPKNLGFAGGVNVGIRYAIDHGFDYVGLLNNDAVADKRWLEHLVGTLTKTKKHLGAVMATVASLDKKMLDGTGEVYTSWGIHYPRGRGEKPEGQYDTALSIFGASGNASLYNVKALNDVGLFDNDFFAYYEDVDLSWRMQLRGWKIEYVPDAVVYHKTSTTSSRLKGFATYQTMKNIPWVLWKNVPLPLLWRILPRFAIVYAAFFVSATLKGKFFSALKGLLVSLLFMPKKLFQRAFIQKQRLATTTYLKSIIDWDLPPDQHKLRRLRKFFTGRG